MGHRLPPDVRRLINDHLTSVDQVDVLLLLRRTAPRAWTAPEVGDELRTNAQMAAVDLTHLAERGLVVEGAAPETYVYRPADAKLDRAVEGLAEVYRSFRHVVITLIVSRPES